MSEPLARLRTGSTLYELEDERTTIGRDITNDLVIDAKGVSRLQAVLSIGPPEAVRRAVLQDEGSTNGTFVNGQRLLPHEQFPLNHGDLIFFSAYEKTSYRFEIPGMEVPSLPNMVLPPAKVPLISGGSEQKSPSRFNRHPTPLDPVEPSRRVGSYAFHPGAPIFPTEPHRTPVRWKNEPDDNRPRVSSSPKREETPKRVAFGRENLRCDNASPRNSQHMLADAEGPALRNSQHMPADAEGPALRKSEHMLAEAEWPALRKSEHMLADAEGPMLRKSEHMLADAERRSPSRPSRDNFDVDAKCTLPDPDMRLLDQSFMILRDCACYLGTVPEVETRRPAQLTDYPLAFHRLANRIENKVLRKKIDDAAQTDDIVMEPKEVAKLRDVLESQTAELQELRRQIAFFHSYFPEDVTTDSLDTRLRKSRDVISSGQLAPKEAQELLEVLVLAQKGLQEQDRRQEVCQRRWRQLLEDLAALKMDNQSQAKLMSAERERHKEALAAYDSTVQSCRQQLEALCEGVTQDALRMVNSQLDTLETERRALAEKLCNALTERDKYQTKSRTEKLRREKADQLYRETEIQRDKLEELQKSTAPERTAQLEALICSLEHKLSEKVPSTLAERSAEADWRTFAIQARQDARRLHTENVELREELERARDYIPVDKPDMPSAVPSTAPPRPAMAELSPRMALPSAGWSDDARAWQAVPTRVSQEQTRPTVSDFWSEDPVSAHAQAPTNPETVDLRLPPYPHVKQVVVDLPDDEISVECY